MILSPFMVKDSPATQLPLTASVPVYRQATLNLLKGLCLRLQGLLTLVLCR